MHILLVEKYEMKSRVISVSRKIKAKWIKSEIKLLFDKRFRALKLR